ncbi:hypothetical protein IW150_004276, partial [Coemansia sp. RSA 2607]
LLKFITGSGNRSDKPRPSGGKRSKHAPKGSRRNIGKNPTISEMNGGFGTFAETKVNNQSDCQELAARFKEVMDNLSDEYQDQDSKQDAGDDSEHAAKLKEIREKVKEMTTQYLDKLIDDGEITSEEKSAVSLELATAMVPGLKVVAANVDTLTQASRELAADKQILHELHQQKKDCIWEIADLKKQLKIAEEKKQAVEEKLSIQIKRLITREKAVEKEVLSIDLMERARESALLREVVECELSNQSFFRHRTPQK